MNSACITQPNSEDLILNNGEGRKYTVDSQTKRQGAKLQNSLKGNDETPYAACERDGGLKTAGDSALLDSDEMGVVNAEREILAGKGRFELQHRKLNDEQNVSTGGIIRDERTCNNSLGLQDLSPNNGNTINSVNHIQDNIDGCGSISSNMNTDSADCKLSIPHSQVLSTSDHQDVSSVRLAQSEGDDADPRTCPVDTDDSASPNSKSNHSRGIETEVIVNQQSNGEIIQSCTGEESNRKTTNMQISQVREMTLTNSTQTGPRPSHIHVAPADESDISDSHETLKPECELASCVKRESQENILDTQKELQVHIPRSCNSNVTLEKEGCKTTHVVNENSSPQQRRPPTLDLAEESTSPATIDITSSEEWDDAGAELSARSQFFTENVTDFTPSPNSQQNSQSSWSSQRTLSVSSTPVEGSSINSSSLLQEGVSEAGVVPPGKGPVITSAVPDEKNNTPTRSRTSTATSLSTDFSSNISIATDDLNEAIADGLVLGEDDVGFEDVNLEHGEHGHPPGATVVGSGAKPKKKGLGGFLTRNIFRKSLGKSTHSPAGAEASPPGWKLFGRVPAKESMQRDHMQISEDFQKRGQTHPPTSSMTWKKRHTGLKEASSTTALILENRPENLPAKNPEEEEKHKEEYTKMLKEAKKKELKLYKQKLKKMAQQLKYEDGIKSSLHIWQQDILPKWDEVKKHKKTRDLWWQGIPPSIRGRVWMLAIKNELNITDELFEIFLIRAKDKIKMCSESESEGIGLEEIHAASRENSVDVIKLDVARTFPHLCIFQKGGPYFDLLHGVLGAYACYRPDVGYVQGMSFIAAVFLLYLDVADAFICFANLLNKSCQLAFFRLDQQIMQSYFSSFEEYFQDSLPRLYAHFDELGISSDLYIIDWMYTLYSKSLPLDVACRVWDVFFRDGEELLFRTALGILSLYEDTLLNMDFIQAAQFLTNIPITINSDKLFKHIDNIDMHQKKFGQVLMQHIAANLSNHSGHS